MKKQELKTDVSEKTMNFSGKLGAIRKKGNVDLL